MEHTVIDLLLDGGRASGRGGVRPRARPVPLFNAKADHSGNGRSWTRLQGDEQQLGRNRRRSGARVPALVLSCIDMEFVQFDPTGMVWPPSVKGILVTEGVRGEGGILKNTKAVASCSTTSPDNYKPQTASDPEEGWR